MLLFRDQSNASETVSLKLETARIRPIAEGDADNFVSFAAIVGDGMTTVPQDEKTLRTKIDRSIASFNGQVCGADAEYFMVMEDTRDGRLVGCAAVYPMVGTEFGFYSFRRLKQFKRSKELDLTVRPESLHITNEFTGKTEVGSLIVTPDWRGTGAGRALAKSRYLLIAQFPTLFADQVFAEMRGYQEGDGRSLFWDAVGRRFFKMSFAEADRLSAIYGNEFIADMMPDHPIYLDLLPQQVADIVGRPHPESAPALSMLTTEGFVFDGCVDIFDAGPQVSVRPAQIATIRDSRLVSQNERRTHEISEMSWIYSTQSLAEFEVRIHPGRISAGQTPWTESRDILRVAPF
ncbi:MAG: arginine N-succinyltransferase [Hyphomonas sp.]|uniref:arginine N-succinyltransferase n=1 Tax=Hyphomonas sp. TaxID=87 RepID=UPI0018453D6E|nr:arginine N-succinyltransferase [Hyphomonas sp.]MBA3069110.1 arginine N-succinyltransferase [Hyphomonas sp.]MBU3919505.1 arginine N-succinyltransferase [Alphaproteobacteria bacterium]MBU4061525.1 arginine N-succinyltransferase [Alphaproteobacteria bacterium]MBU4165383.1 arginine N-succinyltransferase [Alphaproteobacteria bacterium]